MFLSRQGINWCFVRSPTNRVYRVKRPRPPLLLISGHLVYKLNLVSAITVCSLIIHESCSIGCHGRYRKFILESMECNILRILFTYPGNGLCKLRMRCV